MPKAVAPGYGLAMGTTTTEIELKLLLPSAEAYTRLLAHLDPTDAAPLEEQANQFFDTPTLELRTNGLSLRLRESVTTEPATSGLPVCTQTLTLKGRSLDDHMQSPLSVRPEIELAISDDEARAIHAQMRDPLDVLSAHGSEAARILIAAARRAAAGAPLLAVGRFQNTRRHIPVPLALPSGGTSVTLEIDRTVFAPDDLAYEVEVEIPDERDVSAALELLKGLLAGLGIEGKNAPGKATRFFSRLQHARPLHARSQNAR
jgi:uncharacterized protein YjbK